MLTKEDERAVVMLAGAALWELKNHRAGPALDHLEDIQAVLLGGACYAATLPAARPAPPAEAGEK